MKLIPYRGIAHGWAGILYVTLKWCITSKNSLPQKFFTRVEQLVDEGIKRNGYTFWHLTANEKVGWPGWCHGSAGFAFLWSLLFKFTNDEFFLDLAEKTARHFLLTDNQNNNASLCCGMTGQAYALLNLFKITENTFSSPF